MIGLCVTLFPPPPPPPSSQTSPHSSSGLWYAPHFPLLFLLFVDRLTVCLRRQWPPLPPFCCVSSFLSRSRVMAVCHWPAPFPNLATEIFNNLVISPVTITPKSNLHITIAVSPFFFLAVAALFSLSSYISVDWAYAQSIPCFLILFFLRDPLRPLPPQPPVGMTQCPSPRPVPRLYSFVPPLLWLPGQLARLFFGRKTVATALTYTLCDVVAR